MFSNNNNKKLLTSIYIEKLFINPRSWNSNVLQYLTSIPKQNKTKQNKTKEKPEVNPLKVIPLNNTKKQITDLNT